MNYKVSVIIPFYNTGPYIERCIRSLFAQTLKEIEYIFIDDGSTDDSVSILREAVEQTEERKKDVIIISEPVNKGQAAARKRGVGMAHGEYIIHCDSDDYVDHDAYESMYLKASSGGYDIVECGYLMEMLNGEKREWSFKESTFADRNKLISELLLDHGYSSLCNKLVAKRLYDGIVFPTNDIYEDFAITAQFYIKAEKIGYIDSPYYHYVKNSGSSLLPTNSERYKKVRLSRINNVRLISQIVEEAFPDNRYYRELERLKYGARNWLLKESGFSEREWGDTFPEIFPSILLNPYFSWREKKSIVIRIIKYYLT